MYQRIGFLALSSALIASAPISEMLTPSPAFADQVAMLAASGAGLTLRTSANNLRGVAGSDSTLGFNLSGAGAGGMYSITKATRDGVEASYTDLGIPWQDPGPSMTWAMSDAVPGKYQITFHGVSADQMRSGDIVVKISVTGGNHTPTLNAPASRKVNAGGTVKVPFVAKDTDGDALEYTILEGMPEGSSFTGPKNNIFTWDTQAGDELGGDGKGLYTFTAGVRDSSSAAWVTKSFKLLVKPVKPVKNNSPKLDSPGSFDVVLGESVTFDACDLAEDDNLSCDALTYSGKVKKGDGQVSMDGSVFSYVPETPGTKILQLSVSDGVSKPRATTFFVKVSNGNLPPKVLMIGDQDVSGGKTAVFNAGEGEPVFFNVTAEDQDNAQARYGAGLKYKVEKMPKGSDCDHDNGAFMWDNPSAGTYDMKVIVTDDANLSGSAKVRVRIRKDKQPIEKKEPTLRVKFDGYKGRYAIGDAVDFAVGPQKAVDGVNYTCSIDHQPDFVSFDNCHFLIEETSAVISESFKITLTPSNGTAAATRTFTLNVVEANEHVPTEPVVRNHKPTFDALGKNAKRIFRVKAGTTVRFQHSTYSDKDGDALELLRDGIDVTDEGNRTFSWVAIPGVYDVTFRVQEQDAPENYDIQKFKFIVK